MAVSLWERLHEKIKNDINNIFAKYDLNKLSDMEKRRIIYNYLINNLEYDKDLFFKIAASKLGLTERYKRNVPQELYDTAFKHKGVCNGIAGYYKLILDELKIPSYYVVCNCVEDMKNHEQEITDYGFKITDLNEYENIGHALNLVYDKELATYSIDDISLGIINQDSTNYFAYDVKKAHLFKQGLSDVLRNMKWLIIDEAYIDAISGRRGNTDIRKYLINNKAKANLFLRENNRVINVSVDDTEYIKKKAI